MYSSQARQAWAHLRGKVDTEGMRNRREAAGFCYTEVSTLWH